MEIKRTGNKTIVLTGKKEKIVINPEEEGAEGRVVLWTEKRELPVYGGEMVNIAGAGEYEVGGIEIEGIRAGETTMYVVNMERVRVGIIGKIKEGLTEKKLARVGELEVLLFEVAAEVAFKEIVGWARKWGVNYLIPIAGENEEKKLGEFLDEVDEEGLERSESLKIEREELPEGMEVAVI